LSKIDTLAPEEGCKLKIAFEVKPTVDKTTKR